jgi:hypothetical protein
MRKPAMRNRFSLFYFKPTPIDHALRLAHYQLP